ncbi:MAG: hypothetical protein ACQESP_07200 [Candidatus Muiribacteriota bacterium]
MLTENIRKNPGNQNVSINTSTKESKNADVKKCCRNCRFFEVMTGNFGKCKSVDGHGYDLIVEDDSYCETYE